MTNPWEIMTYEEGLAMDRRKDALPSVVIKRRILWNLIERFLPQDSEQPVLDLGGGTGVWAIRIARQGRRVLMTDISPGLLTRAEEKIKAENLEHLITLDVMDICSLKALPDSSFPLVLALGDPLSYCSDAERALREIHRVLADGGVLIGDVENRYASAKTPRRAGDWQEVKRIFREGLGTWPGMKDQAQIREYTPAEIRALLETTGWHDEAMYPSDLMMELLSEKIFQEACSSSSGMDEMVSLEEQLRNDGSLLGVGTEIQFIVRK